MRFLAVSLFMLNALKSERSIEDERDDRPGPAGNHTNIGHVSRVNPTHVLAGSDMSSVTSPFFPSAVKTRHHRGESIRSLVKRSGDDVGNLPEIVTPGQVIRREVGHTAVLQCSLQNLGKYVVMWKQNGRVISAGSMLVRKDDRLKLTVTDNDYNLYISSLVLEDESEYTCEVDIMGRPISIVHRLEVLVAPRIQCRDTEVTLNKGDNYTLRCSAQGQPNPRVSWSRRSGVTITSGHQSVNGLSLQLTNVDRQLEGVYVCTASNGVGHPAMAAIDVNVLYSPEISIDQQYSHNIQDKKIMVKIDCVVHSNPSPQVTWYKDKIKMFETDRVLMTFKMNTWSLKLTDVNVDTFANYTCVASNSLGTSQDTTHVSGKPSKLVFTSPSLNHNLAHYNLTWTTDSFSPILAYKLRFKVSKVENASGNVSGRSGDWNEVAVPVPFMTTFTNTWHYTFTSLHSATVYDVVGMAKNEYGWGPMSSTFTFYNKGIDYSTQQIKYKEPEIEKPSVKNNENTDKNIFEGKLLIQDRSNAVKCVSCLGASLKIIILSSFLKTFFYINF